MAEVAWVLLGFAATTAWLVVRKRRLERGGKSLVLPGVPWYFYIAGFLFFASLSGFSISAALDAADGSFDSVWRFVGAGIGFALALSFLWTLIKAAKGGMLP